jgi:hypothetical protein
MSSPRRVRAGSSLPERNFQRRSAVETHAFRPAGVQPGVTDSLPEPSRVRIRRALLSLASTASALGVPASAGAAPPLTVAADGLTSAQQTGIALLLLLAFAIVLALRSDQAKRRSASRAQPRPHGPRTPSTAGDERADRVQPEAEPVLSPEEVLERRAAIRMAMTHVFRSPPSRS